MPAPGAFIFLAAVSASGCLASPAHPGESVGPSGGPAAPTPTPAILGSVRGALAPSPVCMSSCSRARAWGAAETEPLSAGPVGGRLGAGWGGGPFGQHVFVHACVRAGVCSEPGKTGPLGELGPREEDYF